jgi:hypothetical protein
MPDFTQLTVRMPYFGPPECEWGSLSLQDTALQQDAAVRLRERVAIVPSSTPGAYPLAALRAASAAPIQHPSLGEGPH